MKRKTFEKQKPGYSRKTLWLFLGLMLYVPLMQANYVLQTEKKTISGVVTDASNGSALPGVSIAIKGTSSGTITDLDGKYKIEASSTDVLVFSFVGFLDQEHEIGEQSTINVALNMDVLGLDEVVVIGYGVQKKKLVTGATTQVKSDDLIKNHSQRLESSLQGMTPGMLIVKESGQPGAGFNITVRGLSSPNDNEPLVLIDGVPGELSTLNPSDIESVDILKDAASAAIYGSRGGSGVILVTTKKGEAGKSRISYDFSYGISNPSKKVDLLNAKEYATVLNEASFNTYPNRPIPFTQEQIDGFGEGTDWQQEATNENAPQVNHYLGFSGGSDKSVYSISFSYNKEEGIFNYENKSQFERLGIRINSEHKPAKYLTIGENLIFTHRKSASLGTGNQYNNFMRDLFIASPLLKPFDENSPDGYAREKNGPILGAPAPSDQQQNPLANMHFNFNDKNKNEDAIGNVYAEIEVIKGLKVRTDLGAKLNYFIQTNATDSFTLTPQVFKTDPEYHQKMTRDFGYNWDNTLSYSNSVGAHSFLAMIGYNRQDNWYFNVEAIKEGYLSNDATVLDNVTTVVRDSAIGDYGLGTARESFFGRLSYDYNEKYMGTVSMRRDGSSLFGRNNRYGYFFAASAGWVMSEEAFLEQAAWLDFFKLRASWGQNGKEPSLPYMYLATVGASNRYYYFNGPFVGVSPDLFPNPDLKWEAQEQIDIGFDSRWFKDVSFTFDWYRKTANDWIVSVPVPAITGIAGINENTNPYINGGDVVNTGVEFDLGYAKKIGELFIGVRANMAYNKNKVLNVPNEVIHGSTSTLYNGSEEFYRVEEGYPIGYFWGYVTDGIFQTAAEIDAYRNSEGDLMQPGAVPGDIKRLDLSGDGIIDDEDKTMIGNPIPDYIYGFSLNSSWKGFDFSMNIQGQLGHQIVKCYRPQERSFPNYTTDFLDRWQWVDLNNNNEIDEGEGTSNTFPRLTQGTEPNQNWRKFSDLYIHDADYLRVKSINIGYDLKSAIQKLPFQQFRIYFSLLNALTFTKYNGIDPEVGYGSYYNEEGVLTDGYASGIDVGFYPVARTYMFGVNVKF